MKPVDLQCINPHIQLSVYGKIQILAPEFQILYCILFDCNQKRILFVLCLNFIVSALIAENVMQCVKLCILQLYSGTGNRNTVFVQRVTK